MNIRETGSFPCLACLIPEGVPRGHVQFGKVCRKILMAPALPYSHTRASEPIALQRQHAMLRGVLPGVDAGPRRSRVRWETGLQLQIRRLQHEEAQVWQRWPIDSQKVCIQSINANYHYPFSPLISSHDYLSPGQGVERVRKHYHTAIAFHL